MICVVWYSWRNERMLCSMFSCKEFCIQEHFDVTNIRRSCCSYVKSVYYLLCSMFSRKEFCIQEHFCVINIWKSCCSCVKSIYYLYELFTLDVSWYFGIKCIVPKDFCLESVCEVVYVYMTSLVTTEWTKAKETAS